MYFKNEKKTSLFTAVRMPSKPIHRAIIKELHKSITREEFEHVDKALTLVKRKYKITPKKEELIDAYKHLVETDVLKSHPKLDAYLVAKAVRSWSGVLVVTVVLRADKFSCPFDCKYCPNETVSNGAEYDMPRSYLSSEPAVMRAMEVDFDIAKQFNSRVDTLQRNGHAIDKVEIIVLGGTFSSYPRDYQVEAMRDIYFASNSYFENREERHSLQREQQINEKAAIKIIGISLETRPDQINKFELRRFRELGCTRIQIGVQHTSNTILDKINRKHDVQCSINAIKLMKDFGFKVDIHIMPDLPGASPQLDKQMFCEIFSTTKFKPDYVKIYPCLDITYTEIRKWKADGTWKPYSEHDGCKQLTDLILYAKEHLIQKYVRINRIQRDFPQEHINNGFKGFVSQTHSSNLRQILEKEMKLRGTKCKCIRCREVKNKEYDLKNVKMNIEKYDASEGKELFISFDDIKQDLLLGFIRLRLPRCSQNHHIHALRNSALIRELHVYGSLKVVNDRSKCGKPQHQGFGKRLVRVAENQAFRNGYRKVAIISGVGVRQYYRQMGYTLRHTYMVKHLSWSSILKNYIFLIGEFLRRIVRSILVLYSFS